MTSKKTHKKTIFKEFAELILHIVLFVGMIAISIFNIYINAGWQTIISSFTAGIWFILIIGDIKAIAKARGSIKTIKEFEVEQTKPDKEKK